MSKVRNVVAGSVVAGLLIPANPATFGASAAEVRVRNDSVDPNQTAFGIDRGQALGSIALRINESPSERCLSAITEKSIAPWVGRDFIFLNLEPKNHSATKIRIGVTAVAPRIQPVCRPLLRDLTVTYDLRAMTGSFKVASSGSVRRLKNDRVVVPFRRFKPVKPGAYCVRQSATVQFRSGEIIGVGDWARPASIGSDLKVKPHSADENCSYN